MSTQENVIMNANAAECETCGDLARLETVFFVARDADGLDSIHSEKMCVNCIMASTTDEDPLFSNYAAAVRHARCD